MGEHIEYFVDDKPAVATKSELTVAEILGDAKIPVDRFYLVSGDGVEYRDPAETIEIHPGDRFTTRKREAVRPVTKTIHYTVNGEAQVTEHESLTVETVLRNAGAAASIDIEQLGDYYLESVTSDHKYENLADQVSLHEGEKFLAVHRGKTPVA